MELLDFAVEVTKDAGRLLLEKFGHLKATEIGYKERRRNLVTIADTASERLIVGRIKVEYPKHGILAEESEHVRTDSEEIWIIDPLDGTVNYAHGFPTFSVSVAFAVNWRIEVGVVYSPYSDELFYAERGRGAFLNGERIVVSEVDELSRALLATGFAYIRDVTEHNNLSNFNRLNLKAEGVRRLGSAALDLAYLAAGRLDGFWELFLSPWDVAAGSLLVEEAGGVVTDIAGGGDFLFGYNIVATNGRIHDELRNNLEPFPSGIRYEIS